jgi:hypothetical protein
MSTIGPRNHIIFHVLHTKSSAAVE